MKSTSLVSVEDIGDKDIEEYRNKFPKRLKLDYYDAMILFQDNDKSVVEKFLRRVNTEVLLHKVHKPHLVLYNEILPDGAGMTQIGELDLSLDYCTYVLLYVTRDFCQDGWTEFSSQTCLMEAIQNAEKRWSVVPIFTEPKRNATFKVPPSVRSLKGIQYWSEDKFYVDSLRKLLEDKMHVRKEREVKHRSKRIEWIIKEKGKEVRDAEARRQAELHARREEAVRKELHTREMQDREQQHELMLQRMSHEGDRQHKPMQIQSPEEYLQQCGALGSSLKRDASYMEYLYQYPQKPMSVPASLNQLGNTGSPWLPHALQQGYNGPPGADVSQFYMPATTSLDPHTAGGEGQQLSGPSTRPQFSLGPQRSEADPSLQFSRGPQWSEADPRPQFSRGPQWSEADPRPQFSRGPQRSEADPSLQFSCGPQRSEADPSLQFSRGPQWSEADRSLQFSRGPQRSEADPSLQFSRGPQWSEADRSLQFSRGPQRSEADPSLQFSRGPQRSEADPRFVEFAGPHQQHQPVRHAASLPSRQNQYGGDANRSAGSLDAAQGAASLYNQRSQAGNHNPVRAPTPLGCGHPGVPRVNPGGHLLSSAREPSGFQSMPGQGGSASQLSQSQGDGRGAALHSLPVGTAPPSRPSGTAPPSRPSATADSLQREVIGAVQRDVHGLGQQPTGGTAWGHSTPSGGQGDAPHALNLQRQPPLKKENNSSGDLPEKGDLEEDIPPESHINQGQGYPPHAGLTRTGHVGQAYFSEAVAEPPLVVRGPGHHASSRSRAEPADRGDQQFPHQQQYSTAGPGVGGFAGTVPHPQFPQGHPDPHLSGRPGPPYAGEYGGPQAGYDVPQDFPRGQAYIPPAHSGDLGYSGQRQPQWQPPPQQLSYQQGQQYLDQPPPTVVHHHHYHSRDAQVPTTTINYIKKAENVMVASEITTYGERTTQPPREDDMQSAYDPQGPEGETFR